MYASTSFATPARVERAGKSAKKHAPSRARAVRCAAAADTEGAVVFDYRTIDLGMTLRGTHFIDLSPHIERAIAETGVREGTVNVISRHTTTAVTINEYEERLIDDARMYFRKLAPPDAMYLHNDLDRRYGPKDWPGGDEAWRAQEPENCHSHLLSMLIGNSESVPISQGKVALGTWQSVMFVELDGPRQRTVGIQIVGKK